MQTFYLDTSAINSLYDDPEVSNLKSAFKDSLHVYISVFTIAELASTSNADRRVGLIRLAKDISGKFRPAAMPGDLLKRSLEKIHAWASDMDNSMGPEWDGVWIALNEPTLIDEESYREITEWKAQQETWYHEMHNRGRPLMQNGLAKLPSDERSTLTSRFPRLIRYYPPDSEFTKDFVADMASHSGTKLQVDKALAHKIIRHSEHWRFFLASMAYGMYGRSIQISHFGRGKNPGSIDTQQSIYLPICDVFVTTDQPQYRMLRLLTPFGHKKRQVWKYQKFANWLLNKGRNC